MGNIIDVNNIASANVNDKVILADKVLVKADNGMWVKPLAEQTALINLETNLDGGASQDANSFKDIENKLNTIALDMSDKTDLTRLRTHILPENANTDIGSPTKRFRSIHVDEAYLSTNTLYIGDTPVLGTDADTITIKADVDQSILVKTIGSGITTLQSETEVNINTAGMNADVKLQANGVNSKVRLGANGGIELSSPTSAQSDLSVSGNLTLTGNFVHNGQSFTSNATTVTTKDNIIVLNQGEVGTGVTAGKAGLQIDRGDAADFQLIFDETIDKFTVGIVGGEHEVLSTREYVDAGLNTKVDKVVGKQLSTEDYTTTEKSKVSTIDNKADKANTLAGYGITIIDCGSIV